MNHPDSNCTDHEETVKFKVSEFSSEHPNHRASELNIYRPDGDGWQSEPSCTYPQHIVLQLMPQRETSSVRLTCMKILSHECKIAQKIEIFLGSDPDPAKSYDSGFDEKCRGIKRLGYVPLDCNKRSDYQSRELKSIKIGYDAIMIKLVIHQCHFHQDKQHNRDNQVGIVGITCIGKLETCHQKDTSELECEAVIKYPPKNSHKTPFQSLVQNIITTDPSIYVRINDLEVMKHKLASEEDFDGAARVKEALIKVLSVIRKFESLQTEMHQAASKEDYVEASKLKKKRDKARKMTFIAINEAEQFIKVENEMHNSQCLDDLTLSTIGLCGENNLPDISSHLPDKFTSNKAVNPIRTENNCAANEKKLLDESINDSFDQSVDKDLDEKDINIYSNEEDHPLYGVSNFHSLPAPEAIKIEDIDDLEDSVQKVENIIGKYLTKCFFSKTWSLREAALLKASIILSEAHNQVHTDEYCKAICIMLSRVVEDKIGQVFISGLIFLDDCMIEFEKSNMTQKEVLPVIGKIIQSLIGKLGQGKTKLVESTETALMSLALSSCIGPSYIGIQTLKDSNFNDSKSGKALCSRFLFVLALINEFGIEAPRGERIMGFVKKHGFGHKDAVVREAARNLTTVVYLRDGNDIIPFLDELSDRQTKEYKISFIKAKERKEQEDRRINNNHDHGNDLTLKKSYSVSNENYSCEENKNKEENKQNETF